MDEIQTYKGDAALPGTNRPATSGTLPAVNPAAVKSTSNYLKALKRRFWVVLAIAVPMGITTSILVLKQPPVYEAKVEIEIKPPELDQWLPTLVATEGGHRDTSSQSNFVANHKVKLRRQAARRFGRQRPGDRAQSEPVCRSGFRARHEPTQGPAGQEGFSTFIVSLEGNDPALTKELLENLLRKFKEQTSEENLRTWTPPKNMPWRT